jgi:DNA invertase Pin-like site-specific DNA recombinase
MYAMLGTFAEFERDMIRERIVSGLARAKAEGKAIGRPRLDPAKVARIRELRAEGVGIRKVARIVGCGVAAVQRVNAEGEPAAA